VDGIADVHRALLGNTITLTKLGLHLRSLRQLPVTHDAGWACWVCHPTWLQSSTRPPSVGSWTHELIDNAAVTSTTNMRSIKKGTP
jgi:hypothetical protein